AARSGDSGGGFDHAGLVRAFAFNFPFSIWMCGCVLTRNAGYRGHQWHLAMPGIDLIETQEHARVQSLLHRRNMSPDFLATGNGRAIGSDQILGQLGARSEDTRLNSSHQIISYAVFCLKK